MRFCCYRCANSNLPSVLSMDCEMCETTDPVTGEKCENALVRFSVIDCTNNGQVILTYLYLCSKYLLEVTLAALDVGPD